MPIPVHPILKSDRDRPTDEERKHSQPDVDIHAGQPPFPPAHSGPEPVEPDAGPYLASTGPGLDGSATAAANGSCGGVHDGAGGGGEETGFEPVAVVGVEEAAVRPVARGREEGEHY